MYSFALFYIHGIVQNLENLKQGMVIIFLTMAIKNWHIIAKGSKDRFRDFVYIDDAVDVVLLSVNYDNDFSIYNVCIGKPTKVENVISQILFTLNDYSITVDCTTGTPDDQFGIVGNNQIIIINELRWFPKYDFSEGMTKMIS